MRNITHHHEICKPSCFVQLLSTCCLTLQVCCSTNTLCTNTIMTEPKRHPSPLGPLPGKYFTRVPGHLRAYHHSDRARLGQCMTLPGAMSIASPGSLGLHLALSHRPFPMGSLHGHLQLLPHVEFSNAPPFFQSTLLELDVVELSSASIGSLPFQQCPQMELNLTPFRLSWGS